MERRSRLYLWFCKSSVGKAKGLERRTRGTLFSFRVKTHITRCVSALYNGKNILVGSSELVVVETPPYTLTENRMVGEGHRAHFVRFGQGRGRSIVSTTANRLRLYRNATCYWWVIFVASAFNVVLMSRFWQCDADSCDSFTVSLSCQVRWCL